MTLLFFDKILCNLYHVCDILFILTAMFIACDAVYPTITSGHHALQQNVGVEVCVKVANSLCF